MKTWRFDPRGLAAAAGFLAMVPVSGDAQTVTIVGGNGYKPLVDKTLPDGGMMTALARRAYEKAGYEVKTSFPGWVRGEKLIELGDRDAMVGLVKTEDREGTMRFPDPLYVSEVVPVTDRSMTSDIESFDIFRNKDMCLTQGYNIASDRVQDMVDAGEVTVSVRPSSVAECMRLVSTKRADFMVAEAPVARYLAQNEMTDTSGIKIHDFVADELVLYTTVSKELENSADLVEDFNQGLASIKDSGTYQEIVSRHLE